jgi:DNA polymerase-3 subunit delta
MARAARRGESAAPVLGPEHRIVVLHGKELFLVWEHSRRLAERLKEVHGDVAAAHFDGVSASAAEVLDELRSFGLLAPHTLVIVDDAERFLAVEGKRRALEAYAGQPEAHSTLLLRAGTWRPGNLDKMIAKVGAVVRCDPVPEAKALAWCVARAAKRHEATLQRDAAELLVERIGVDLGRLDGEIAKLSAAAAVRDGSAVVGRELVVELVGRSREEEAWLIQEVLLRGDPAAAVAAMRELLSISRAAPQQLTWALSELARKLEAAASLREAGVPDGQIAKQLRLWGDTRGPILTAARRVPRDRLAGLLHRAVDLDFRMKRGRAGDLARSLEAAAADFAGRLSA